jgi:hypothetical protein
MAWGIFEDKTIKQPPGTVLLDDRTQKLDEVSPETAHLKKQGDTILQPQPSDSPNDPLNWSLGVKLSIFITLIVALTAMGGVMGMLGTAGRLLAERFGVDYPVIVQTLGPPGIASTGIALYIVSPVAAVYDKRVQFFLAICTLWFLMIAGIFANSLGYYRNMAIVMGICLAPYELLLASQTISSLFIKGED